MSLMPQPTPSPSDAPGSGRSGTESSAPNELPTAEVQGGLYGSSSSGLRVPGRSQPRGEHQPAHAALICVAAPQLAISAEHGQITGEGLDGFYHAGRRVIARCQLRLAGREPVPLQGRMVSASQARFIGAAHTAVGSGPDPEVTVERLRWAEGTERIIVRNAGAKAVRLPLELRLGTDLAELSAVAVGGTGTELPASVHGAGLAWSSGSLRATVVADPGPETSVAQTGVLRWDWEVPPGGDRAVTLSAELAPLKPDGTPAHTREDTGPVTSPRRERPPAPWSDARASSDDGRVEALLRCGLDDMSALLQRDPLGPSDLHIAAGVPWRCALAPAESLRTARMLLPLGTELAGGTLRTLVRGERAGAGLGGGRLPGALRHAGPHAPASSTGIEATLLFPVVLAEARRWGLPEREVEDLVPSAERCLRWLLDVAGDEGYVPDPAPDGPYRCEMQAHAHRAALLGADLLDAFGQDGGPGLREWAASLRDRFREDFWYDDRSGGRPLALRTRTGGSLPHLGCTAVELLDTGLIGGGLVGDGLLDGAQTEQLARLLAAPSLDSGWGLRSLGTREPRHNAFGHRSGAIRVQETATAVSGLAAAGYEKEAGSLLMGVIDAAEAFGWRLPEMYAAGQRTEGGVPVPHPAACRPAAVAAASAVHMLAAVSGVRPDVPSGTVSVRPMTTAPLGAVELTGLRVAQRAFSVRVSRLGVGLIEEAAGSLQLVG